MKTKKNENRQTSQRKLNEKKTINETKVNEHWTKITEHVSGASL